MPEIGYWKYVRFNDDEPQYFGADDDVTIVFDSADDRLEYKMKKDIRYEDDAGNEILTIQKATRTLSGFKMAGNLDLDGNLLQNAKLGTTLNCNSQNLNETGNIYVGVDGVGGKNIEVRDSVSGIYTRITGAGVVNNRGLFYIEGTNPAGAMYIRSHRTAANAGVGMRFYTHNSADVDTTRLEITAGEDSVNINIYNARLNFADQFLAGAAGALQGYFVIRVGGTQYKVPAYALT